MPRACPKFSVDFPKWDGSIPEGIEIIRRAAAVATWLLSCGVSGVKLDAQVRKVSNNPLKITLPCVFNPESTLLCDRWLLDDYDKAMFVLVVQFGSTAAYELSRVRCLR